MRPVLFLFYTLEIFLNVAILTFHVEGFIKQPVDYMPVAIRVRHGIYTLSFYVFNSITMWASINLSLGEPYELSVEIARSISAFVLYISISLWTLNDAETDFHLMYIQKDFEDNTKVVHPFFKFMRLEAIFTMVNGFVYLLHSIIMLDVVLAGIAERESHADKKRQRKDEPEVDFKPVHVYFLGRQTEMFLEKFQWYREFKYGETEVI